VGLKIYIFPGNIHTHGLNFDQFSAADSLLVVVTVLVINGGFRVNKLIFLSSRQRRQLNICGLQQKACVGRKRERVCEREREWLSF